MSKPKITIIGLGVTGSSIGLGLQKEEGNFEIIGHDKEPDVTRVAERTGSIHRTMWNIHRACEDADMIILAVPLSEMAELFSLIAEDLKEGCLVFAINDVLQPIIELADKHFVGVHFVAGHPVLTGIGGTLETRADLFKDCTFCVTTGTKTAPDAVQLACDFVERLGAKPLFMDAAEHDGLVAGVDQLPQMLAVGLMQINSSGPAWSEARQLAGRTFANATEFRHGAQQLYDGITANRQNLLLRLDMMQALLSEWRQLLHDLPSELPAETPSEESESPQLLTLFEQLATAREDWEAKANLKRWDDPSEVEITKQEGQGLLQQMFFGGLMGNRQRALQRDTNQAPGSKV
ncbi:MAG: prephenate dehydrogenase/arogenate dehydrogenase family protein [Chloroflexota bacterium]